MLLDTPQSGCEGDNGFIGVKVINYNLPIISTKITKKFLRKVFSFRRKTVLIFCIEIIEFYMLVVRGCSPS